MLVQVGGQKATGSVVEVGGQLGSRSDSDGSLHGLAELLVTDKDKLVLSGQNGEQGSKDNQKLEHFR